eukprot:NODE_15981_length_1018_cov_10.794613.p1 GENE.NODE_15981_length_1018_cov_10.794613~~NODE_15981_length_1018_cov_10.794613.p1  ORF type:complete len:263 (-),score=71.33 NODE_15981_length_1018_cov_10.794613:228-1016(-)
MTQTLSKPAEDVIVVNAGGMKFEAQRSTLCTVEGSMLAAMFSGRWDSGLSFDANGAVQLDVSARVFEAVLSHLRALKLDPLARAPLVCASIKGEMNAFCEFMMMGFESGLPLPDPNIYAILEVRGIRHIPSDTQAATAAEVEHILQSATEPHEELLSFNAAAGARIKLRLPFAHHVTGVKVWLSEPGWRVPDGTVIRWTAKADDGVELGSGVVLGLTSGVDHNDQEYTLVFTRCPAEGTEVFSLDIYSDIFVLCTIHKLQLF